MGNRRPSAGHQLARCNVPPPTRGSRHATVSLRRERTRSIEKRTTEEIVDLRHDSELGTDVRANVATGVRGGGVRDCGAHRKMRNDVDVVRFTRACVRPYQFRTDSHADDPVVPPPDQ